MNKTARKINAERLSKPVKTSIHKAVPVGRRRTAKEMDLPKESLRPIEDVKYGDLTDLIGFWMRRAQISLLKSFSDHLGDLRPVESAALIILFHNRDLTQNTLAAALSTDQSTMVGISTKLEDRGWVERRRLADDRRYQVINLTSEGRKMAARVQRMLRKHNENMLRNLDDGERKNLFSLISKMVT
jgi:DNA-binding MarR family transcriptional regulator